jgi:hypothetical protein
VTIKDPAVLAWFICHRLLLGQELTEILPRTKKIMAWEIDIAPRTMSRIIKQDLGLGPFKRQAEQCFTVVLKDNKKKIKMPVVVRYRTLQRNPLYR